MIYFGIFESRRRAGWARSVGDRQRHGKLRVWPEIVIIHSVSCSDKAQAQVHPHEFSGFDSWENLLHSKDMVISSTWSPLGPQSVSSQIELSCILVFPGLAQP
jgi:hypothetical protein